MARRSVTPAAASRTWILDLPDQPHPNPNSLGKSWEKRHRLTQAWREAVGWIAKAQSLPRIEVARLDLEACPPDHRRRDLTNLSLALKAAEDGLTDAGVLPDDDLTHVVQVCIRAGRTTGTGQWAWRLHVTDTGAGRG